MTGKGSVDRDTIWRALITLVVVDSLLLAPVWIQSGGPGPHWVALEAVLLTGLFLLLPRNRWSRALAWVVAPFLVLLVLLDLADTTARLSLARPLNLYLDLRLADSVVHLLQGSLGPVRGLLFVLLGVGGLAGALWAVARLLGSLPASGAAPRRRWIGGVTLVLAIVAIPARWLHPRGIVLGLPTVQLVREQTRHWIRMTREGDRFAQEMAVAPAGYGDVPGLLDGLGGKDVILAFVESYGFSSLEDPRYGPVVRPRLEELGPILEEAGLHVASGLLLAPSQGGMSWLGHGSVLSGLWLENQLRYDLLLASDRTTLVDDFEAAGYRTAALMPAITLAWPEGERFGYQEIWARKDIDYAGPPLNWVTMPDQFTWWFLESRIRSMEPGRPLFAELGLISSHAPWTPILPVLEDWRGIGDGSVFQRWADAGERPEELWRDRDRVRAHYARAVAYAVEVMGSYAAEFVGEGTLLVAMGDHQPAPLVTGEDASRAVPVHVISGDPAVVRPFLDWGFVEGTIPDPTRPVPRMDEFRDWFVRAFSDFDTGATP